MDARGSPAHRFYRVRWEGKWAEEDKETWEPWKHLVDCSDKVDAFWAGSKWEKTDDIKVMGEHRCPYCCKNYESGERYLKSHLTKKPEKGGCERKPRSLVGTKAEKAVKRLKIEIQHQGLEKVWLEGKPLKNSYSFKYLGFNFDADGRRR